MKKISIVMTFSNRNCIAKTIFKKILNDFFFHSAMYSQKSLSLLFRVIGTRSPTVKLVALSRFSEIFLKPENSMAATLDQWQQFWCMRNFLESIF